MEPALTEYNCRVEHFSGKGGAMLSKPDFLEATRRYKNKKLNGHERQRYHALLLVTKGYSYRQTADILFVDEQTISQWVRRYQQHGLDGLKNHPLWGGEHGQRQLSDAELVALSTRLEMTAMPGTGVELSARAQTLHQTQSAGASAL